MQAAGRRASWAMGVIGAKVPRGGGLCPACWGRAWKPRAESSRTKRWEARGYRATGPVELQAIVRIELSLPRKMGAMRSFEETNNMISFQGSDEWTDLLLPLLLLFGLRYSQERFHAYPRPVVASRAGVAWQVSLVAGAYPFLGHLVQAMGAWNGGAAFRKWGAVGGETERRHASFMSVTM